MEVCEVWLARDFLARAGRPLDIPPCDHPPACCPPTTERTAMTTNDLAEAERRIIHQTREQAIAEIGADRYNQLITVFVDAHKNDPGTIGNPLVIDDLLHPDEWTGEGIAAMLAANPEPPAWYEQQPPADHRRS